MSTKNADIDEATLDEINQVGNTRRQELRGAGYNNVGDVAHADATELFEATSGISASDVETIVTNAREMVGEEADAEVETSIDGTPAKYVPEDEQADEADDEEPDDPVDAFLDSIDDPGDELKPHECDNVAILAGDDAFDVDGPYGDLSVQEEAALVASKLEEFGFEPETISTVSSGMGSHVVKSWVRYSRAEGIDIPGVREAGAFEAQFDEHDDAGDAFQARNEELLEWADGICVIANGDYIGMWVTMTNEYDTIIRTPMMEDDESDE